MKPFLLLATRAEDVPADEEYQLFLKYSGLTEDQLVRVRLESGPMPDVDLDDLSGIFVGGGPFNASDPPQKKSPVQHRVEGEFRALLDQVVARDFPFLGACYGVGTLGRHQGGIIDFEYGEEVGPVMIEVTPEGTRDPLLFDVGPRFEAYVGHLEACSTLPPTATLLATSAHCPVQMFRVKENLYGTQFHPELDYEGISERIDLYRHVGYFPADQVDAVKDRCFGADVAASHLVIRNFVERYAD